MAGLLLGWCFVGSANWNRLSEQKCPLSTLGEQPIASGLARLTRLSSITGCGRESVTTRSPLHAARERFGRGHQSLSCIREGPANSPDPIYTHNKSEMTYFCCSAGFSAGCGALVWLCCGLGGVFGFWSPEVELGALVILIPFHKYLKNIFSGTVPSWRLD
jgi:hypothetical protein